MSGNSDILVSVIMSYCSVHFNVCKICTRPVLGDDMI